MEEAHMGLIKIIRLIEEKYGKGKITPNLHLSLHLCKCTYDYGPLYSFWCFLFERMNGFLGKMNSFLLIFYNIINIFFFYCYYSQTNSLRRVQTLRLYKKKKLS